MSYRAPPPGSPGLPPTLYSGMSSLQIGQPAAKNGGQHRSSHPTASQPHKALLKAPKAEHAQRSRKSERPGSPAPWKDPRQTAAASAGHRHVIQDEVVTRRIVKEEAVARQMSPYWSVFPPDARSSSRRDTEEMLRTFKDCLTEEKGRNRELLAVNEQIEDVRRTKECLIQAIPERREALEDLILRVHQIAPYDDSREACQKILDAHYDDCRRLDERLSRADPTYPPRRRSGSSV